ncbi:hypothetical protein JCM19231_1778 [Vibrio ishigakensis]|uniref:Uncharacterized protein n=1 Tax=Vibrio ishigakensis TaxID=1481914 RepID=A0A0B8P138_9VIBR|nr:hypothetical protein JCM19231_1778 [Vibrio ishigakensis]
MAPKTGWSEESEGKLAHRIHMLAANLFNGSRQHKSSQYPCY